MTPARNFVLIPGAWMGAWAWEAVVPALQRRGHQTYALTLSGLVNTTTDTDVGLHTHVQDVITLLDANDLHDVILVGHSYSGIVAGLVADRVPERIGHTVYIGLNLANVSSGATKVGCNERKRVRRGLLTRFRVLQAPF